MHAYLAVRKKSQYWFAFSTDENSDALENSVINDGWSMLAMFLTVLYKVEDLEKWKKWTCVIFKCYSSEKLITPNILHEVVPT